MKPNQTTFKKVLRLTEAVFTKTEMNTEWNDNFFQNSPLGIQHNYSIVFFLFVKTPQNFFWYEAKLCHYISFYVLYILKSYSWNEIR